MIQKSFEKAGLKLIKNMLSQTNHKNLILTGGTALNVVANNFYRQNLSDDVNLYIDPVCGDEGNCLGICQHYLHETYNNKGIKKPLSIYVCGNPPTYNILLKGNETEINNVDETVVTEY
jgi:predicted NodU family carbamoyl transferase